MVTRTALPGDPDDTQSRYIEAAVNGVLIGSLYAPNGNPQPGPKFAYKLAWLSACSARAQSCMKSGAPVVLAGDYNVVPTPFDIYPTQVLGRRMRWCSRKAARRTRDCSSRAGSTRCARCIRTGRCTHSGITCASAGSATPGCASIICC